MVNTVKLLYIDTSGAHFATRSSIVVILFSYFWNTRLSFSSFLLSFFFSFCFLCYFAYCHRFLSFCCPAYLSFPFLSSRYLMLSKGIQKWQKELPRSWGISLFPFFYFYNFSFSLLVKPSPLLQKYHRNLGSSGILDGVFIVCRTSKML